MPCGTSSTAPLLVGLALAPDTKWLSPIEAAPVLGGPALVAIASDGTKLRATADAIGRVLTATPLVPADSGEVDDARPSPRSQFVSFYSRMLGGVIMAGGVENGDVPLHDVWWKPNGGHWTDVTPHAWGGNTDVELGRIRAATYSPRDRQLWFLDERTEGGTTRLRLLRAPLRGAIEVLAEWAPTVAYDRRWLTVDREGHPLLTFAITSGAAQRYVVARLDEADKGTVVARLEDQGPTLLAAPFLGARELRLVTRNGSTTKLPRIETLPSCAPHGVDDSM